MVTVTHSFVSGIADNPQAAAAGEVLPSHWNANHVISGARTMLTANTTYYVRTTGSDSNGGTNSSTDAFATLQHAWDFLAGSLDLGQFVLTIDIGAGTFTLLTGNGWLGGKGVHILGAGSASTNLQDLVFADASSSTGAGGAPLGPQVNIDKVTLTSAGATFNNNQDLLFHSLVGTIAIGYLFGDVKVTGDTNVNTSYFHVFGPGVALGLNISSYSGNTVFYALWSDTLCEMFYELTKTGTLVGSPTYGTAFAESNAGSNIISLNYQFSGAVGAANFAGWYAFIDGSFDIYLPVSFNNDHAGTFFPNNPGGAVPLGYLESGGHYHGISDLFPRTVTSYIGPATNVGPVAPIPGARGFVTDASTNTFATILTSSSGGGTFFVPMFADGTNWRIG